MSFGYIVTTPISIGDIQARLYPYGIMCRYQTSRDGDLSCWCMAMNKTPKNTWALR
jgi:hypothetical protein